MRLLFVSILIMSLCVGFYYLGKSHAEIKIVKEQVEVIKYVNVEQEKKHANEIEIYSAPNSDFNGIVDWLRGNKSH